MRKENQQQLVPTPNTITSDSLPAEEMPTSSEQVEYSEITIKKVGRPKGGLAKKNLMNAQAVVLKTGVDPLEFLLNVVKNRRVPIDQRIRAAQAACIHIHPKLSSSKVESRTTQETQFTLARIQQLAVDPKMARMLEEVSLGLSRLPKTVQVPTDQVYLPAPEDEPVDVLLDGDDEDI